MSELVPNAVVGDVLWFERDDHIGGNRVLHRIASVSAGQTPADTDCEDYKTACGVFGQSWSGPVPQTLTASEIPDSVTFCDKCFRPECVRALKENSWEFGAWQGRSYEVTSSIQNVPCRLCRKRGVVHAYAEMGTDKFYDAYIHICINLLCGYVEASIFLTNGGRNPASVRSECPFCPKASP